MHHMNSDVIAPEITGLTSEDIAQRLAQGRTNKNTDPHTKSVGQICAEHIFTLFNGINLILAVLVATTGSWRNLTFLIVVFANLGIGIVQEIRSKRTIDRLSIIAERPVCVRRGGADVKISHEEIVADDVLILTRGDQVSADAEVIWGTAGLNESLLTGESEPITKQTGDELMSGSFLDSGALLARVVRVGAESYAARINAEAKHVKHVNSEIMLTLNMIIRFAAWLLVPIGVLLFLRTLVDGAGITQSLLTTIAALLGMIPQGLVLLTSAVLAIATARLARKNVLIQQFYSIEMLAHVDVLCLDKTGTITSGSMDFSHAEAMANHTLDEVMEAATTIVQANAHEANETAEALLRYAQKHNLPTAACVRSVAFSSARKYSGCVTREGSALVMGAAQFILGEQSQETKVLFERFGPRDRVLVVCQVEGFDEHDALVGTPHLIGALALSDHIRTNAPQTITYFIEQGVTLNVISGDDPRTVSNIAAEAGIKDADAYVDATTLTTPELLEHAAETYHVFGRVTPQQKRELIRSLQRQGHTVAMTGDGVNDVLALREADCSVAMASGSDAARDVSEVVLVDNDFAHMPAVVNEGRRSINNLQRSASLFLVKTIFSAALALLCAFMPPYPFQPVQISLISVAIIGVPSFVLALEPNHERVRGNFLANVLARALPTALAVILAVGVASLGLESFGFTRPEISTLCVLLTSLVGLNLIVRISLPLNFLRSALLCLVVGIIVAGYTVGASFFEMVPLSGKMWLFFVSIGCVSVLICNLLFDRFVEAVSRDSWFLHIIKCIEEQNGRRWMHESGSGHNATHKEH